MAQPGVVTRVPEPHTRANPQSKPYMRKQSDHRQNVAVPKDNRYASHGPGIGHSGHLELGDPANQGGYVEEIVEYVEEGAGNNTAGDGVDGHEIEERVVEETQADGSVMRIITHERVRKRARGGGSGDDQEEREVLSKVIETTTSLNGNKNMKVVRQQVLIGDKP